MMTSLILGATARLIVPLLLLFSFFLLARGHNEPGGGFAGGLVAAAAFTLVAIAQDSRTARRPNFQPPVLIGVGLLIAIGAGMAAIVVGEPWFTGQWVDLPVAGDLVIKIGTPLIFDLGVYLVVLGMTLGIVLELIDEQGRSPRGPDE